MAPAPSTGAQTGATNRKTAATKRSTTAKKAATTRARGQAASAAEQRPLDRQPQGRQRPRPPPAARPGRARSTANRRTTTATRRAESATRTPVNVVTNYAERAVLIPVGAALVARDRVVSGVNHVIDSYSTPTKAQARLKKFERRGSTARKGLEREVRKTRTRVERELRQRRRNVEKTVTRFDRRRGAAAKNLSAQVEQASAQVENAVQTGIKESAEFATRVQERVLNRV